MIFLLIPILVDAQNLVPPKRTVINKAKVNFPEVPRVSAYEAYVNFKAGKAIIIHAGGIKYENRHIIGALNIGQEAVAKGLIKLPKLPRKEIEIFTYCY